MQNNGLYYIKKKFKSSQLFAIGFSLGANLLTKYLGELGSNDIKKAICIGNPWDFKLCNATLPNQLFGMYSKAMFYEWHKRHLEHEAVLQ